MMVKQRDKELKEAEDVFEYRLNVLKSLNFESSIPSEQKAYKVAFRKAKEAETLCNKLRAAGAKDIPAIKAKRKP